MSVRWNCDNDGCFNLKKRLKFDAFDGCFGDNPKIGPTDVDLTMERNGHFLFIEWKGGNWRELPRGQQIYARRLTMFPLVEFWAVHGDAETMTAWAICSFKNGQFVEWEDTDLAGVRARLSRWWALANRAVRA